MIKNKTIAVWFSCGAASAVAAKKTIELYGKDNTIRIINNPIKEEHEDNQRFLIDVEKWLGLPVEHAINNKYPDCSCQTVWEKRRYMAGPMGAPCTVALKKEARLQWEQRNPCDYLVLGFTAEEQVRADRFRKGERDNLIAVLVDEKITKEECYKIIKKAGIKLPEIYFLGYPNANCIGCVKASSATYWNHVRKVHPAVFKERADLSRELGAHLVYYKGKRIFLDELPLKAKGRSMKTMQVECGIFCTEEWK